MGGHHRNKKILNSQMALYFLNGQEMCKSWEVNFKYSVPLGFILGTSFNIITKEFTK